MSRGASTGQVCPRGRYWIALRSTPERSEAGRQMYRLDPVRPRQACPERSVGSAIMRARCSIRWYARAHIALLHGGTGQALAGIVQPAKVAHPGGPAPHRSRNEGEGMSALATRSGRPPSNRRACRSRAASTRASASRGRRRLARPAPDSFSYSTRGTSTRSARRSHGEAALRSGLRPLARHSSRCGAVPARGGGG